MRFTCRDSTWQRLEVSVILFSEAINLLAFMDDLITARSVPEGRWILEDLIKRTSWAKMEFKPAKSRSLVLKRGHVQDRFRSYFCSTFQ